MVLKKQAEEEKNSKLTHGVDDKLLHPQFLDVMNFKINTEVEQCLKEEEQNYKTENEGMYEKVKHCENNNFVIDKGALDTNRIQESMPEGRCIVDFSFLWKEIHRTFDNHSRGIECQFKDWKLINSRRNGLMTQLFFKC